MAQIFNAAGEVRIWLGEYSSSEDESHTTDRELFWSLCQRSSPWWTRLWIIQECAYAAREPVIMIGACSMTFERLIKRWESVIRVPDDPNGQEFEDTLATALEYLRTPFDAWKVQMMSGAHRLPLSQRIRETHGRHCSDPHDKIYALLSLIHEDEEKQSRPDYRKPFMDLMLEVSEVLRSYDRWNETHDCDLLSHFELEPCVNTALTRGKPLQRYIEALEEASHQGYTKVAKALLNRCAGLVTTKSHIKNALLAAAGMNRESIVRLLLAAGADVNAQGGRFGNTLQAAAAGGHEEVVHILLDAGADVNAYEFRRGNALQAAAAGGHEKVVQMLLAAGADVNAQGGYYGNALQAAAAGGHEKVVQMLLAIEANVDALGGHYGRALQAAAVGGHEKVVQMLLAAGAGVNAQWGRYSNALQAAAAKGHEKVVLMLLNARAR